MDPPSMATPKRTDEFFDLRRTQPRRSLAFLASGATIGLLIAGYGLFTAKGTRSHSVPPESIALVNNLPILRNDFMTQVQTQFSTPFEQTTPAQRKRVLDDMIAEELMVQRGREIDLPSFDPEVRAAMVAGVELEVGASVLAQQPSEAQLHGYYEQHKVRYMSEGILRMRELVAKTGADRDLSQAGASASQAVNALRAGQSLEAVMQRYRLEDSGNLMAAGHVDTGDIFDFAAKAKLAATVYASASRLPAGTVSDPISQPDGVHVVVMLEHRMPVQRDYAEAADNVWADYKNDAQARVRDANLRYLRSRADLLLSEDAKKIESASGDPGA